MRGPNRSFPRQLKVLVEDDKARGNGRLGRWDEGKKNRSVAKKRRGKVDQIEMELQRANPLGAAQARWVGWKKAEFSE